MRLSHAKDVIKSLTRARLPVFLWGPPGVGKSDSFKQVCVEESLELLVVITTIREPVDLSGVPSVELMQFDVDGYLREQKVTRWNPPEWLPRTGKGIVLWDDLPNAHVSMQSSIMQLILERQLGSYRMPEGWTNHAAGNRVQDRSGSNKLITSLANRFGAHIEVEVSNEDWQAWALDNNVHPAIRACLAWKPTLLHSFDPASGELAFPTPRSWSFADRILKSDLPEHVLHQTLAGCVGKGAAAEFMAHRALHAQLPDFDELLKNPKTADIPKEPSVLYSVATTLADRAKNASKAALESIVEYGVRLPKEITTMLMIDCQRVNKLTGTLPIVAKWCKDNSFLFTS